MIETDEQFEQRLGINYNSDRCEARWQKHHDKIITDAKSHCAEIWEGDGQGNFKPGAKRKHCNDYSWEEWE